MEPQRLIEWGQQTGVACSELITRLLQTYKHPEHGYRSCLGLLSMRPVNTSFNPLVTSSNFVRPTRDTEGLAVMDSPFSRLA